MARNITRAMLVAAIGLLALQIGGCKKRDDSNSITIDGSSTVYPISKQMAEDFQAGTKVRISVSQSGTGGGFDKFSKGETDVSDASRPIKDKERAACKEAGVEYIELKVAIDGISVVVNKSNRFCKDLTVEELKQVWIQGSTVKKWSDIRDGWPEEDIVLCGPDSKSGTYDYFIEEVLGKKEKIRTEYRPSTSDDQLVDIVSKNEYAMGFFGFAYYIENKDEINAVAIAVKQGDKPVPPTPATIKSGQYTPLSRPLFIYVSKKSLQRDVVADFVKYYLHDGQKNIAQVGYVELDKQDLEESRKRLTDALK